jgi:hypothetical protein
VGTDGLRQLDCPFETVAAVGRDCLLPTRGRDGSPEPGWCLSHGLGPRIEGRGPRRRMCRASSSGSMAWWSSPRRSERFPVGRPGRIATNGRGRGSRHIGGGNRGQAQDRLGLRLGPAQK